MRDCFCPYLDGPEICGKSYPLKTHGVGCKVPYSGNGRKDCPIINERGDREGCWSR